MTTLIQSLGPAPFLLKGHARTDDYNVPITFYLDLGKQRFMASLANITVIRDKHMASYQGPSKLFNYNDNWFESLAAFQLMEERENARIYQGSWIDPFTGAEVKAIFTIGDDQLKFVTEFHQLQTINVVYHEKITDQTIINQFIGDSFN